MTRNILPFPRLWSNSGWRIHFFWPSLQQNIHEKPWGQKKTIRCVLFFYLNAYWFRHSWSSEARYECRLQLHTRQNTFRPSGRKENRLDISRVTVNKKMFFKTTRFIGFSVWEQFEQILLLISGATLRVVKFRLDNLIENRRIWLEFNVATSIAIVIVLLRFAPIYCFITEALMHITIRVILLKCL